MAGEEVDLLTLVTTGGFDIGDFGAAALEFDEDGGFKHMAAVGLSAAVEDRDEGGVGGVNFAGIHLASLFGIRRDRHGVKQEGILTPRSSPG